MAATDLLKRHLPDVQVVNVDGGLQVWSQLVDPSFPLY